MAAESAADGKPAWRLPTVRELMGISAVVQPHYVGIASTAFPDAPPGPVWSADADGQMQFKAVDVYGAYARPYPPTREFHVRLVKAPSSGT